MSDKTQTDEYYDMFNSECYAPAIIGRKLTQTEVDQIKAKCDEMDEEENGWGEEYLIEALEEFKKTM